MKLVLLLSLVALAFGSDVLEFTDSDFATKVAQHSVILVEFFAPWCGHCKKLAPQYEQAATTLKRSSPPVALAKVDCTENSAVCGKYGVSGYPTLKIFRDGEFSEDYNGPREAGGIVKTMKSKAGPSSVELTSVEAAEKITNGFDNSVVGFFTDPKSDMAKEHSKAASALSEKYSFAHSSEPSVLEKYGYSDEVVLFRANRLTNKFEESRVKYEGSPSGLKAWISKTVLITSDDNVVDWMTNNIAMQHGLCGHRTSDNSDQFEKPLVVAYYDVDYVKNTKGTNYWRNRVMKVAKKMTEAGHQVNFAVSNYEEFSHEAEELGLSPGGEVQVAARNAKNQKFAMQEKFSMDTLETFVTGLMEGTLEPHIKSEPVPEPNDGPVKVVVGKNFDEIVNDPERDVLIEFYAPWCGHCKSLEPKYTELGEKMADEPGITIAKMDATANDVPPQFSVQGFPTIFFAPKGNKESPRKYEGGREVADFIKYLATEATGGLKTYNKMGKKEEL